MAEAMAEALVHPEGRDDAERNTKDKFGMEKPIDHRSSLSVADGETAQCTGVLKVLCCLHWQAESRDKDEEATLLLASVGVQEIVTIIAVLSWKASTFELGYTLENVSEKAQRRLYPERFKSVRQKGMQIAFTLSLTVHVTS